MRYELECAVFTAAALILASACFVCAGMPGTTRGIGIVLAIAAFAGIVGAILVWIDAR